MKGFALFVVAAGLALCAGCGPARTLTESEFKGFCYNAGGSFQFDCDTISLCNEYLIVLNTQHESRQQCRAECQRIYTAQFRRHILTDCSSAAGHARGWCQRYCQGAYPQ